MIGNQRNQDRKIYHTQKVKPTYQTKMIRSTNFQKLKVMTKIAMEHWIST
mgnify:CR=1 FL=1